MNLDYKILKYFFRSLSEHKSVSRYQPEEIHEEILFNLLQKKPIVPSSLELKENPPSRSAKLRCLIKKENFYDFKTDILDKFKDLIEEIAEKSFRIVNLSMGSKNRNEWECFFNSIIISVTTGIIVCISGFIISSILVINYKNMIFQQSIFLISSSIIIISPIIFSLGYFIILGELRYVQFFKYFVIVLINCLFLLPFSILPFVILSS